MSPGAQNMKAGTDALVTIENESWSAEHENGARRPWISSETSSEVQNLKIGPDALGIAENESGSEKHENETRRPRSRRK
jgi:hypothetical protein